MKMRRIIMAVGIVVVLLMLAGVFRLGMWVEQNRPTKEVMALQEIYEAAEDEAVILLNTQMSDIRAKVQKEHVYLPFAMVQQLFLPRLYVDEYENMVLLTTPTKVYCFPIGSSTFTVNEKPQELGYSMAIELDDGIWIALEYLQTEVDMEAVYLAASEDGVARLLLFTQNKEYLRKAVKKNTQVRTGPGVKNPVLKELSAEEEVYVLSLDEENKFEEVMTEDGIIGYVRSKHLRNLGYIEKNFAEREEDSREAYTSVTRKEPVVLVWHQLFNQTANSYLADKLEKAEGVNVVSPTWFSIENNNGKLTTLANWDYVELAHSMGIQVWPLVNDFEKGLDYDTLFGSETGRRNLINNLFYFIYTYDLDGINIDFENITAENCRGYIQFLRELSVACRNEGIVLSVDNYVPMEHTAFYDRAEQGILVDYVMVMAYDEHYAASPEAGSVSSLSWVKRGITATLEEVPAEKLVVGLPFYSRLWKEKEGGDGSISLSSEAVSMNAGLNLLDTNEVAPVWEEEVGQYYAEWQQEEARYRIWLEEERSLGEKLRLVSDYDVAGVAFWKLGLEREAVWPKVQEWKEEQ